ncbi:MAG: C69 family dipeptidase [Myxococcota bacterium]|jgi:dipeptidase
MCDTIVALPSATADGVMIFGKNSDREPDEAQNVVVLPGREYETGSTLKCTLISIPQADKTCSVMLCKPFWMWGAEMGANEHGVVIGNEAVFTRETPEVTGLTGMDLLRLALERSKSAAGARDEIIDLLERYGQGGNCGYRMKIRYMNSFIIADRREAYVLETIKRWWAWKKITDVWSISNVLSIGSDFDACSAGLMENAVRHGWYKGKNEFSLRDCYSDRLYTWGGAGKKREAHSRSVLEAKRGSLELADAIAILRDHGSEKTKHPDSFGATVCMHAADTLRRRSQTVGSMASRLSKGGDLHLVTGASNPCISPFFPVFSPGTTTPSGYVESGSEFERSGWWWKSELLHRKALGSFGSSSCHIGEKIQALQKTMLGEAVAGAGMDQAGIDHWFSEADSLVEGCLAKVDSFKSERSSPFFRRYWKRYNTLNKLKV